MIFIVCLIYLAAPPFWVSGKIYNLLLSLFDPSVYVFLLNSTTFQIHFCLFLTGESLSDQVHQNPPHLITKAEKTVQINCSHTIKDYKIILWYQQLKGNSALNLIGYVYYKDPTTENQYKNQFSIGGNGEESSTLNVTLEREHVALYYCAASKAQHNVLNPHNPAQKHIPFTSVVCTKTGETVHLLQTTKPVSITETVHLLKRPG
uniref:Ig-like domain-containing protein n=1 Tax=Sinocyclocheilus grahami TaxID=75366 RepID=A0A672MXF0_SINGR